MKYWTVYTIVVVGFLTLCFGGNAFGQSEDLDDPDITLAVETELIVQDAVPSHKIDISTEEGIVTLSGSVDSYFAKIRAEEAAESVKGVLAVINNIDVEAAVRADARIRSELISALIADPVTESFEINVSVEDGITTLSGSVDSYAEKLVAEDIAEDVQGVVDVKNLLTYEPVIGRTDAKIQQDIKSRLRADASMDAALVTILVDEGEVTLDGSVGSAAEKTEAETEAWMVPGVQAVNNNIEVQWWLDDETAEWSGGWTDDDMQRAIENALLTNPRVSSFNVTPVVDDGVAILTGTVDNLQAKRAAEEEAGDILGVWRVKNHLRVRSAMTRSDIEIAGDIRNALQRDPYTDRYGITVTVHDGKAYLSGEVDSWYMKNQAEEAAAAVPGVIDIQNNLDVDYEVTAKTDEEIKDDVESQLWWSPFVDSDDISVEVHSGVASLMGTVEDYDEYQAAMENAREGGATEVISKLEIENGFGAG